jgi:hypothetical protein
MVAPEHIGCTDAPGNRDFQSGCVRTRGTCILRNVACTACRYSSTYGEKEYESGDGEESCSTAPPGVPGLHVSGMMWHVLSLWEGFI